MARGGADAHHEGLSSSGLFRSITAAHSRDGSPIGIRTSLAVRARAGVSSERPFERALAARPGELLLY